jgi:hypothetical protein
MLLLFRAALLILMLFLATAATYVPFTTKYILGEDSLLIKAPFSENNIRYATILSVKEERISRLRTVSFSFEFSLSRDQIHIEYRKNQTVMIASIVPLRRQEFIEKLRSKIPDPDVFIDTSQYMPAQGDDVYRSKISISYYLAVVFMAAVASFCLYIAIYYWRDIIASLLFIICVILTLLIVLAIYWTYRRTSYTFKENSLLIEAAVMLKENIGYSSIIMVKETRYAASACDASMSTDQIEIKYDKRPGKRPEADKISISPVKKEEFLAKLVSKLPNPNVHVKSNEKG